MRSPFVFGKIVTDNAFINREKEIRKLKINLLSGINTILISPRRWGKTSLVNKTAQDLIKENRNMRFCFIDLFEIKNEKEFYEVWLKEILKASATRWEEWVNTGKEMLKGIIPSFSFGIDPQNDFSVKIELQQVKKNSAEILNLPEKIAKKKKLRFIICIDEFQKIAQFDDSLNFQQKLRAKWQYFQETSFCLYGSKRHIITDLFEDQSMPFYRFGDTIYLKKIEKIHWKKYIADSFLKSNKSIPSNIISLLIKTVNNHPYHVQQLAHQVWINTQTNVTVDVFNEAVEELLTYNEIMYIREIDKLSSLQISFIEAIVNKEKHLTSKEVIKEYDLGTTGNINRLKRSVENKEIIDFFEKTPVFIDPLFELWFKQNYLKH